MKKFKITVIIFLLAFYVSAQEKFALVIGNSNYTNFDKLNNPANDAVDMKNALESLGFHVVHLSDSNLNRMKAGVTDLKEKLSVARYSYGFFYFAGHGVQSSGENYLIPVDANIQNVNMLPQLTLPVEFVLSELEGAGNELNVIVMDTCRDLPSAFKPSASRGLTVVTHQPSGSIIVYATKSGRTALDGSGRNGLFTSQLLRHIVTPGIEVKELFNRTGADVIAVSNNNQIPTIYNNFYGIAYLGRLPVIPGPPPLPSPPPQPPQPEPAPAPANMVTVKSGTFIMGSPAGEEGRFDHEGPQHQVTVSSFYMGKHEVTLGEFRRFVEDTWYKTEAEFGDGGYIWTGSEWLIKEDANWKNPYFNQDDNHPVVLVSWFDAIWYCNWLSIQEELQPVYAINGRSVYFSRNASGYRLPTEAEWEYACRAGTTTAFNTGNSINAGQANHNNAEGISQQKTSPVGSFLPNLWGLYDMHGNVDEWCWDWESSYDENAQTDPAGANSGFSRVVKGGGWYDRGQDLRSASRGSIFPSGRNNRLGFRVVRNIR